MTWHSIFKYMYNMYIHTIYIYTYIPLLFWKLEVQILSLLAAFHGKWYLQYGSLSRETGPI